MKINNLLIIFVLLIKTNLVFSTELYNKQDLINHYKLSEYLKNEDQIQNLKIAILDNGFSDLKLPTATLPETTQFIQKYDQSFLKKYNLEPEYIGNPLSTDAHGLYMAQIVWAMTGQLKGGPKLFLLNANGITNFRRAVQYAIDQSVDIILYSQNWEFGGNFDGNGFINKIVNEATSKGIFWINASGNDGGHVFNGAVLDVADNKSRCLKFKNLYDRNQVSVIVSWNDFSETEDYQTTKDLDIGLLDNKGEEIAKGNLAQQPGTADGREHSLHAREKLSTELQRGEYCLSLKTVSQNFTYQDKVRVVIQSQNKPSDSIDFTDRTSDSEIMIPADNPTVITVGDNSPFSSSGTTIDGRKKPDVILDLSEARFTDGLVTSGSSNAAAVFAGMVALLKSQNPKISKESVLKMSKIAAQQSRFELNKNLIHEKVYYAIKHSLDEIGRSIVSIEAQPGQRVVVYIDINPLSLSLFSKMRAVAMPIRNSAYYVMPSLDPYKKPAVEVSFGVPSTDKNWVEVREVPANFYK